MILFANRDERTSVVLGGHEIEVIRARLGKYLVLSQLRRKRDVRGYLAECGVSATDHGLDCLRAYLFLIKFNEVRIAFPFLQPDTTTDPNKEVLPEPWEYDNRWIASWIHHVASHYGWSLPDILNLVVEDFFALLQEIMLENQIEREWGYSLSELAYPYNEASKMREFKPLKRPSWMRKDLQPNPRYKNQAPLPEGLMPMGASVDISALINASKS